MFNKFGKAGLVLILSVAVLMGAYLGYYRYFVELQDRTVELCVDLNDVKKIAAFEKRPVGPVLEEIKKLGISSIGVFEETLPDANALGEIYYAKGVGVLSLVDFNPAFSALEKRGLIKLDRTYIYVPNALVRERIFSQLRWALGNENVRFLGAKIIEVNEAEEEIRELGLGLSGAQEKYLTKLGFNIIPRIWNDPRYDADNIGRKISEHKGYDKIIFDGEEILGYPDSLGSLAATMGFNKIKYGYIEIVKQDGDKQLRRLMSRNVIRVHSVPKDELKKIKKDEAVKRFVRAARERKVRLIYIRPFLPPQVEENPVDYNLAYFGEVTQALKDAGFVIGRAEVIHPLMVKGWQITILGLGVVVGALFLLNYFVQLPIVFMYLLLIMSGVAMVYAGSINYVTELQKGLALLVAIVFPSLAVISVLSQAEKRAVSGNIKILKDSTLIILNVIAEAVIGIFLLIGLLADYRFMLGVETFSGVKLALLAPVALVALYFILQAGEGSLKQRITAFLNSQVKLIVVFSGLFALGALMVFVARSGNFVLPVPGFEKGFREILETILLIRPRTKEFLVGYPFLYLAAIFVLRGNKKWIWVPAAIGVIAPISVINSFSHIHTPIMVSMIRTVNGLVLGVIIGAIVMLIAGRFIKK